MKKDLLIGLAVGFGLAFAWNKMRGKDCGCEDVEVDAEEVSTEKKNENGKEKMTCDEAVRKLMMTMRFGSPEQRDAFYQNEMKKCMNTK